MIKIRLSCPEASALRWEARCLASGQPQWASPGQAPPGTMSLLGPFIYLGVSTYLSQLCIFYFICSWALKWILWGGRENLIIGKFWTEPERECYPAKLRIVDKVTKLWLKGLPFSSDAATEELGDVGQNGFYLSRLQVLCREDGGIAIEQCVTNLCSEPYKYQLVYSS